MSPIFKKQTTNGNVYTLNDPYSNLNIPKEEEATLQCRCPEFWLASKVVTDPERRFVSDSKIAQIESNLTYLNDNNMSVAIYDPDADGIIDRANIANEALSILWDNIRNKPNMSNHDIEMAVSLMHSHTNIASLNKLTSNSSGDPLWNNAPWPQPDKAKYSDLHRERIRNIIIDSSLPVSCIDGDIWIQINDVTKEITNLVVMKNGVWYPMSSTSFIDAPNQNNYWYGIQWDVTDTSPTFTRIAQNNNFTPHQTLPVQSRMRGCILADNGMVNKYLDPDDWSAEILTGVSGQIMIEIPEHYILFETDGNIRRAKISLNTFMGATRVPKRYVGAFEASSSSNTINSATKLCSKVDLTVNNGKPFNNQTLSHYRTYARNRAASLTSYKWNIMSLSLWDSISWLYYIEYGTRNSRLPYNPTKTADGFMQGGLGPVPNQSNVVCGTTNIAGNNSYAANMGSPYGNCYRYRGIEFPFGSNGCWVDGVLFDSDRRIWVADRAQFYKNNIGEGFIERGMKCNTSEYYYRDILFGNNGYIIPTDVSIPNSVSSNYWCSFYTSAFDGTALVRGGDASLNNRCGFAYTDTTKNPTNSISENIGTRLCYLPEGY